MTSGGADGDVAALCGRNLPVIVAEICVQRVQIETHSHGGAHQLRDHLSKAKWEKSRDRNDWNQVSLCYCALNSAARQRSSPDNAGHFSRDRQSVSKLAVFPVSHCVERRVCGAGR